MFDSVRPHSRQPTRLHRPWDSPGKNTGVGCHFLLQCMKVKSESEVTQSCLTLSDPMDCSLPGSSVHEIFQARVLEWVAIAFSISHSRDWILAHKQICLESCNLEIKGNLPPYSSYKGLNPTLTHVRFCILRNEGRFLLHWDEEPGAAGPHPGRWRTLLALLHRQRLGRDSVFHGGGLSSHHRLHRPPQLTLCMQRPPVSV